MAGIGVLSALNRVRKDKFGFDEPDDFWDVTGKLYNITTINVENCSMWRLKYIFTKFPPFDRYAVYSHFVLPAGLST